MKIELLGTLLYATLCVTAQAVNSPLITSPALTGAAQGTPFAWPVTASDASAYLATNLPPGLSIDLASGLISGTATAPGVYEATVTATNGVGSASQNLRIVVNPSGPILFREDFNNGLAAPWTTVPAATNYYSFPAGMMNLRASGADIWVAGTGTPNLFAVNTPTAGDFMITLGVSRYNPSVPSAQRSPSIMLTAWDDRDNYVYHAYTAGNGGRTATLAVEIRQSPTAGSSPTDFGSGPFLLRLVKRGNVYSAWWSTTGTNFVALAGVPAMTYANFVPMQLGFWMGYDPAQTETMLIDYFEVSALTMNSAGSPPAFATANLTGGLQGAPFLWESGADYADGYSASGLPPGLGIAPLTGRITGTPTAAGVYDATVTATNRFGFASQTLRIVVRSAAGVLFRDDFTSGPAANWKTVPTNNATALPGVARVRANNGDVAGAVLPEPFSVSVPISGDFTLTLGLTRFVPGNRNSPGIFLMAWQDFDHLVRFGTFGIATGQGGQLLMESGANVFTHNAYGKSFGSAPFLLRLTSTTNVFTSSYSTNGVDFMPLPGSLSPSSFNPTNTVGFWAGIDPYQGEVALVDYFELASIWTFYINSPSYAFVYRAQPFSFLVSASGANRFAASGLPPGLSMNEDTGLISGMPSRVGNYSVAVTAWSSNTADIATQTLRLSVVVPPPTNNLPPNLVAWWRGENNASDQMGLHHGTLSGDAGFADGISGQAFSLIGQNYSVELGAWFNLQQFTLSLWVKPAATQVAGAAIIDNNFTVGTYTNGSPYDISWMMTALNTSDGAKSQWAWWPADNGGRINFDLAIGEWQHVALTRGAGNVTRLYMNGTLLSTATGGVSIVYRYDSQSLHVGRHNNLGQQFNGQIDEFMCFDRDISSNEVAYLAGRVNPYEISMGFYLVGGKPQMMWNTVPSRRYQLQYKNSLTNAAWSNMGAEVQATEENLSLKDETLPAPPSRFYRVVLVPEP